MEMRTQIVSTELASGNILNVEATVPTGMDTMELDNSEFGNVTDTLQEVVEALERVITSAKPTKATVEFGVEVSAGAGKLTALLVKGSGTANLNITLEWGGAAG